MEFATAARSLPLLGARVTCPLCRWSFRFFTRGGTSIRAKPDGYCPRCNAKVRHRWFWLNLDDVLPESRRASLDVLHVAPAHSTYRALGRLTLRSYVPVDLSPSSRSVVRFDLCEPGLAPGSFDVAVCIHVLEHLDDDRAALRALHGLVRPGGLVVIGVPVRCANDTLEDPAVIDPAERARRFGEPDHRRWYGTDIVERLGEAGFDVDVRLSCEAPESVRDRYGLTTREGLFLCRRRDPAGGDHTK